MSDGGRCSLRIAVAVMMLVGCERAATPDATVGLVDEPSLRYRNVESETPYVGDAACADCHEAEASAYAEHAMARSFHRWTPDIRTESALDQPRVHAPTGFYYTIIDLDTALYQEEYLIGPGGTRLHELRRRIDYVMGSGAVARTYFTEENGRLFQLPLTWYRVRGWDFSPGYEVNNARFTRLMPNPCLACHGSYPEPIPFLEGKYASLPPGIGCERCHGPGALHAEERASGTPSDSTYDDTIVNPSDLPFERRLDVCEQCHLHTPVRVLREGQGAFDYVPSQALEDHAAFFKTRGSIDIVSHADRLRQSRCFVATRPTDQPLECATCHHPHRSERTPGARNAACQACHPGSVLARNLAGSGSLPDHTPTADCVECHMPTVRERAIPHGTFTDHWIRVTTRSASQPPVAHDSDEPVEAFYERDRTGREAGVYQAMGEIMYATRAPDLDLLRAATAALDRDLGGDTTRADALFLLGVAYRQLGRTDDAVRALEMAVRVDGNRPERLHALARAYESAGRDAATIVRLYEQALELQPALAWIRTEYADFLLGQGQVGEAEAAYRTALAERPSLHVAAFNLGTLLIGQGRLGEAADAFRDAVRLDPLVAGALSRLVYVRTSGDTIVGVRGIGSPLETPLGRLRDRSAVQLVIDPRLVPRGVAFANVAPGTSVRLLRPDGTLIRALPPPEQLPLTWDLRTDGGAPVGSGLYEGRVMEPGTDGSHRFYFGVIRVGAP